MQRRRNPKSNTLFYIYFMQKESIDNTTVDSIESVDVDFRDIMLKKSCFARKTAKAKTTMI